ncbi:ABC transporter substrate-binding protein [Arthrobacter crystallopoietes]|uniref:ABC transporter substrate-binding protein n=1 Tax=Crystallibacter crystallopoietes TaxID=37928 RepID=UPI001F0F6672|nr:ABC transporter substrate-binding protein [Arthrobacter crystallopoietes]
MSQITIKDHEVVVKKLFGTFAAGVTAMALLAGCGGGSISGSPESSPGNGGTLQKVTVGAIPIAPSAALQLGIDKGLFAKHGIEIEMQSGQGGASMLPAVSTGTMNVAIGNPVSTMLAQSKGLDLKIISGYSRSLAEGDDITGVVALKDSAIETIEDLEGKTVSVNTVAGQGDITIKEAMAKAGADPESVKFTEIAFPDAPAQLEKGNADAVWLAQPFLSQTIAAGHHVVSYNYQETIPGQPTLVAFASGKWAADNPELIEDFKAALVEVSDYAQTHQDEVRALLPSFLKMDPELANDLLLEEHSAEIDRESLEKINQLMVKYDVIESPVNLNDVVLD